MSKRPSKKSRLDELLVCKGFVESRSQAERLIRAGQVFISGQRVDKPGKKVSKDEDIRIESLPRYVSRGGEKIETVVEEWGISISGKRVLDVGCSTGGFMDFMLQKGAREVWGIDVGKGVVHPRIRKDPRTRIFEKMHILHWEPETEEKFDLITVDLSFISLKKVISKIFSLIKTEGDVLLLVKPQFELEPRAIEKGGIVKNPDDIQRAINSVKEEVLKQGFEVKGISPAGLKGRKGNQEYFMWVKS